MAKIKINSLPDGFELKDGKVMEVKKEGGKVTGDQKDYGLVTFTGSEGIGPSSADVRYSLASVPRDQANLEAEGGETVLTDLNDDGNYGLYDIKGPRHGSGGVPMFLPEQSFIFSDTKKLKLTRNELTEFDIASKKKLTPAKVSKKYPLNEFYGKINDEFADEIQVNSAELMLQKNMPKLSQLAFMQELKKNFADGVPLAAHPHLMSIGLDPIEFTAKVEGIAEQEAQQKALEALPYEQRQQMEMLQQMMASAEESSANAEPAGAAPIPLEEEAEMAQVESAVSGMPDAYPQMPPEMMPPEGLPEAQAGVEWRPGMKLQPPSGLDQDDLNVWNQYNSLGLQAPSWLLNTSDNPFVDPQLLAREIYGETTFQPSNTDEDAAPAYNENYDPTDPRYYGYQPPEDNVYQASGANIMANEEDTFVPEREYDPTDPEYYGYSGESDEAGESDEVEATVEDPNSGAKRTVIGRMTQIYDEDIQAYRSVFKDSTTGEHIDGSLIVGGTMRRPLHQHKYDTQDGHNYGTDDLSTPERRADFEKRFPWVKDIPGYNYTDGDGGWVLDFQRMYTEKAKEICKEMGETNCAHAHFFKEKSDPDYVAGSGFDGKFGMHTYSAPSMRVDSVGVDKVKTKDEDGTITESPQVPGFKDTRNPPSAQWWLQDLLKMNAITQRDRDLHLPWQPPVKRVEVDNVLEDPTRAIAAINEQLAINTQAAGAFGGPQSLAARTAQAQGKAATAIANEIGRVNSRNVGTINRGKQIQARFDLMANQEQDRRNVKEYDDTQRVLQLYTDERNFDREQYADAAANAITNRANTYNLNSIQDYYKIDPMSGGMIGQFSDKAFDPVKQKDPYGFMDPYFKIARKYKTHYGEDPSPKIMEGLLAQYYANQGNLAAPTTNIQQEFRNTTGGYGQRKDGGQLKKYIVPFYVGKTGL